MARFGSRIQRSVKKTQKASHTAVKQAKTRVEKAADNVADTGKVAVRESRNTFLEMGERAENATDNARDAAEHSFGLVVDNVTEMIGGVAGVWDFKDIAPSHVTSGLGDLFFPSNPKLRRRAMRLESGCAEALRRFAIKKMELYV
ncbi:MAG: hypothetical protein CL912_15650 [Deltaproteobacteria bacterium]|nr:hypothetical protein [Deltaproteobacteria bacterium]|tara:strand:- start:9 stop:443 length:435 start_codon:yes stop_codon:yes gene_type:complete